MSDRVHMMDPPRGWRYGFPRPVEDRLTIEEQLRKYGYPEEDMELAKKYTRYWYADSEGMMWRDETGDRIDD